MFGPSSKAHPKLSPELLLPTLLEPRILHSDVERFGCCKKLGTRHYDSYGPRHYTTIANSGPDQTVNENSLVTFNGTFSTDNVEITSYVWTFVMVRLKL